MAAFRPHPERVTLASGRPILVVPYAGHFATLGQRVLVGWDASREATRAVGDAMPLLAAAEQVTVLAIDPQAGPGGHGELPGADISLHLARHGVKAVIERTVSADVPIGDVLLSRAADLGADLLVMGAYGHSRARELLLGGATRTVLGSMTLPVLMSH
jgi:nucleotide-binding universal stress UspA family protein